MRDPEEAGRFAVRLRQMRATAGISQTQLGGEMGFRSDTLSALERGAMTGIPLDLVAAIAQWSVGAGFSLRWLFGGAGPMRPESPLLADATDQDIKEELAGRLARDLLARRDLVVSRPAEAAAAPASNIEPVKGPFQVVGFYQPGFQVVDAEQLPENWHGVYVPIIGRLAAGEGVDTIEAEESPPGWANAFLIYEGAPAGAFAVRVVGNSMEPEYRDGDMVVVDPDRPARSGICCVICDRDGDRIARLKRLRLRGRTATLESLHPDYPPVKVPATGLQAYRLLAHLPTIVERPAR